MELFTIIFQFSLIALIMANGFAMIVGGPATAKRLNLWVGRMLWRYTCRATGRLLLSLGRTVIRWGRR